MCEIRHVWVRTHFAGVPICCQWWSSLHGIAHFQLVDTQQQQVWQKSTNEEFESTMQQLPTQYLFQGPGTVFITGIGSNPNDPILREDTNLSLRMIGGGLAPSVMLVVFKVGSGGMVGVCVPEQDPTKPAIGPGAWVVTSNQVRFHCILSFCGCVN